MLNLSEEVLINNILRSINSDELIKEIINRYANQSVNNARELINHINHLTDIIIAKQNDSVRKLHDAAFWLMVQNALDPKDKHALFAMMTLVCKTMIPDGKVDPANSKAEIEYFENFKKLLLDENVFSWDRDKDWADMNDHTEYLKLVEDNINHNK